jgi:hypothetical protein
MERRYIMAKTKWSFIEATGIATAEFKDEKLQTTFDMKKLYPEGLWEKLSSIGKTLAYYGLKQKLADACARDAKEKLTAQEAINVMLEVFKRLVAGNWNAEGVGRVSVLTQAKEHLSPEELAIFEKAVQKVKDKIAEKKKAETK